jgi:hypothetical protein
MFLVTGSYLVTMTLNSRELSLGCESVRDSASSTRVPTGVPNRPNVWTESPCCRSRCPWRAFCWWLATGEGPRDGPPICPRPRRERDNELLRTWAMPCRIQTYAETGIDLCLHAAYRRRPVDPPGKEPRIAPPTITTSCSRGGARCWTRMQSKWPPRDLAGCPLEFHAGGRGGGAEWQ